MKIKILHPAKGYSYFGGEIADVTAEQGADLVARGYAVMIPETVGEEPIMITNVIKGEEIVKRGRRKA